MHSTSAVYWPFEGDHAHTFNPLHQPHIHLPRLPMPLFETNANQLSEYRGDARRGGGWARARALESEGNYVSVREG